LAKNVLKPIGCTKRNKRKTRGNGDEEKKRREDAEKGRYGDRETPNQIR